MNHLRSRVLGVVGWSVLCVAPWWIATANARQPISPIPAHELNFSPTFGGHPADLTLLARDERTARARPKVAMDGAAFAPTSISSLPVTTALLGGLGRGTTSLTASAPDAFSPPPPRKVVHSIESTRTPLQKDVERLRAAFQAEAPVQRTPAEH
jgi:hypothetical protein